MNLTNRNATPTNFGFQYQINVAIYFMFAYLKELKSLRVEGQKEDVEIQLKNNKKFMVQAKSQTRDLYNNSGNSTKLKKALIGLAESDREDVEYMFYASNMLNPLNSDSNEFDPAGIVIKKYSELSPDSKEKINHQIKNIIDSQTSDEKKKMYDIKKDKLVIIRIPFFGDFDDEKYRYILDEASQVLSFMSDTLVNKRKSIVCYWESKFLNNSATNPRIIITKNEICNCLILTEVDTMDLSDNHISLGIEETDYYSAYEKYKQFIDNKINKYESMSKVYSLFKRKKMKKNITITDFVKEEGLELYNYFFNKAVKNSKEIYGDDKLDLFVSQIISYAILRKKYVIDKIREEAGE